MLSFREVASTIRSALSNWGKTARLCVVMTVITLDWILFAVLTRH